MGKSQATFGKKENEKKRLKKKNDKADRKEERQANAKKGQRLEDMLAYVDEFGNISATPPDPKNRKEIKTEDIRIAISKQEDREQPDVIRKGTVAFFNESKGYGFIKDQETQESIFVHANGLLNPIKENDKVTFEVEMGQKGPTAVSVKAAEKAAPVEKTPPAPAAAPAAPAAEPAAE
ncbi:cold-shock protein [Hymenobacter elongatus]|uniref:Cold shock domain-containing protein n=1 Tax=Hymenobacter elongatus TaxID=877208 RepID=A0A4Z0PG16_9BACT|nr:cold shock domain-containing protein [Hymenobacter elongatus]TGE13467.1 cold shock domain-containing protein [Hymenobacter elongatus]